ncbi:MULTISPECIES: hypothetical protein [Bacillaceae]|nr:hypothetical protein [Bacillus sp. PK3_68]
MSTTLNSISNFYRNIQISLAFAWLINDRIQLSESWVPLNTK